MDIFINVSAARCQIVPMRFTYPYRDILCSSIYYFRLFSGTLPVLCFAFLVSVYFFSQSGSQTIMFSMRAWVMENIFFVLFVVIFHTSFPGVFKVKIWLNYWLIRSGEFHCWLNIFGAMASPPQLLPSNVFIINFSFRLISLSNLQAEMNDGETHVNYAVSYIIGRRFVNWQIPPRCCEGAGEIRIGIFLRYRKNTLCFKLKLFAAAIFNSFSKSLCLHGAA